MNERTNERTNEQTAGRPDARTHARTSERKDERMRPDTINIFITATKVYKLRARMHFFSNL